ncbi:hypothetical protein GF325_00025 [Candidatus Bathyarchaeota archaeon]|nr:hypothetical protein [Candidatus Bathyarchaeota archaeon]
MKGHKTHAKGEGFSKELERKGRYFVTIGLVSLGTIKDYDLGHRGSEFYFKVGTIPHVNRVPQRGTIRLQKNQTFTTRQDMSLWNEFIQLKTGDEKDFSIKVGLYERDPNRDDVIAKDNIVIKLGAPTEYIILQSDDGNTKAKLKVSATKTSY